MRVTVCPTGPRATDEQKVSRLPVIVLFSCKQYRFLVISGLESRDYPKRCRLRKSSPFFLAKSHETVSRSQMAASAEKINLDENQNRSCNITIAALSGRRKTKYARL